MRCALVANSEDYPVAPHSNDQAIGGWPKLTGESMSVSTFLDFGTEECIARAERDSSVCYLGFEPSQRQVLRSARLSLIDTSADWQEAAADLKDHFIAYVSSIGRLQADKVQWWATRIASRSNLQTDFFSVLCLLEVAAKVLRSQRCSDIVVDDYRVFFLLKTNFDLRTSLRSSWLAGMSWLLALLRDVSSIVFQRISWLVRLTVRQALTSKFYSAHRERGVFVYTWPEARSFDDQGKFLDPYLPHLERFAPEKSLMLFVPSFLDPMLCRKLVDAGRIFTGIDRYSSIWARIHAASKIAFFKIDPKFRNLDLRHLWLFEILRENRGHVCSRIHEFSCWRRFFREATGKLVFPYEGQPWEKMMIIAADAMERPVQLIGYQHSSMGKLFLSYNVGPTEVSTIPLPDIIIANSDTHQQMLELHLKESAVRVVNGGSLRYSSPIRLNNGERRRKRIGVMMPTDKRQALELLTRLVTDSPPEFDVVVKMHPDLKLSEAEIGSRLEFFDGSAIELYQSVDGILYCSSTSGLEAFAYGIPVFRFIGEFVDTQMGEDAFSPKLVRNLGEISANDLKFHDALPLFSSVKGSLWREVLNSTSSSDSTGPTHAAIA